MQLAPPARWFQPSLGKTLRLITSRMVQLVRPAEKRLRLCESLSLGDKRMVAVIEFGRRQLLVGVTPAAVSLLAELPDENANTEKSSDIGGGGNVGTPRGSAVAPDGGRP